MRKHGTRSCYMGGCRRPECMKASSTYEVMRRRIKHPLKVQPVLRGISDLDMNWLAGIIEGEGSFVSTPTRQRGGSSVFISIQMTDRDILERVSKIVGYGCVRDVRLSARAIERGWKPTFVWRIGAKSVVRPLLSLLFPIMGNRRQKRIKECLAVLV